jgi:UDP-2,4-diacetamido-2,4,6-trideoxy-beta-L-altropyranose hydrolase
MKLVCREAGMDDAELLWRWANDAETRRNAFSKATIPFEEHFAWLERRLRSDATRIWVFSHGDDPVGQVRFDIEGNRAEIDIAVAPERRGRGYGKAMLTEAIDRLRAEHGARFTPRASVLEANAASLRMFRACGFTEVGAERRGDDRAIVLELPGTSGERKG